jgi:uncharacterized protein
MMSKNSVGRIGWIDLTVSQADNVRDFYQEVVGWQAEGQSMGDYDDYNMSPEDDEAIAGICHKQGTNSKIPSVWMIYITVENLDESLSAVKKGGGKVLDIQVMGDSKVAFIQDPAGAVCALWQENAS